MKVFENIKKLGSSIDFERIVRDLLPLRNSESKTYEYIESFLHSDKRLKLWKEDRREAEVNGVLGLNPELQEFVLREGEVDPDDAPEIRKALLQLIKDDKVSFAYLYYILGSEQNRIARYTIYNCIPPSEEAIDYAIRFDLDALEEEAEKIDSLNERFNYVLKKERKSKKHSYEGEPKDRFEKYCEELKKGIKETITLQNALRYSEVSEETRQSNLQVQQNRIPASIKKGNEDVPQTKFQISSFSAEQFLELIHMEDNDLTCDDSKKKQLTKKYYINEVAEAIRTANFSLFKDKVRNKIVLRYVINLLVNRKISRKDQIEYRRLVKISLGIQEDEDLVKNVILPKWFINEHGEEKKLYSF